MDNVWKREFKKNLLKDSIAVIHINQSAIIDNNLLY